MNHKQIASLAEALGGVPVWGCLPGSPSHAAGIRAGDILLEVNGLRVKDISDYVKARDVGLGELAIRLFRDGQELQFQCTMRSSDAINMAEVVTAVTTGKMIPLDLKPGNPERPS